METEDAQTKVIWRFIGRILSHPSDPDAVDGREYFYKYADAEGQLRKSGFVEIVTSVAKVMLNNSGVLDKLIQSAWTLVLSISPSLSASGTLQSDVTKRPEYLEFKKQICSKLEDLFPIVAQSLFRFFGKVLDANKNFINYFNVVNFLFKQMLMEAIRSARKSSSQE
jgi:hypothetical protein